MDISRFYSICLQGNVLEAIDYLESCENKNEDVLKLEKLYKKRFLGKERINEIKCEDPWINNVLSCYYVYFRSVLTNNSSEMAENQLMRSLSSILKISEDSDPDEIESKLENIFNEKGYSFLGGVTAPYRGPYIWKTTKKKDFKVTLPGGEQQVTVFFISDFLMLSWAHYATFGKYYAGGWAKTEGLYYVNTGTQEIDTDSVDFQISFLKHEAQHLWDYGKFPDLNQTNLEYRAKLVELIYSPYPTGLIEKFIFESRDDRSLPHPYAAFSITKGLSLLVFGIEYVSDMKRWRCVEPDCISKAALSLFLKNDQDLQFIGNKAEGVI